MGTKAKKVGKSVLQKERECKGECVHDHVSMHCKHMRKKVCAIIHKDQAALKIIQNPSASS